MNSLHDFRLYYNHTIHPELMRLERKRVRLLWLLFISIFLLLGIIILELYINVFLITMFLMIPVAVYITFVIYQIRQFILQFKPRIVNLILKFIDVKDFEYHPKKSFPKKDFLASKIFSTSAPSYDGEDYIKGRLRDVEFEMGELYVKEFSKVRSRLNYVFRGIMLKARFEDRLKGKIYILPEEFQQYLSRSIKDFTREGAYPVELALGMEEPENASKEFKETYKELKELYEEFEKIFMIYATPKAPVRQLLSKGVVQMLIECRREVGKEIYLSSINGDIYIAVTEDKDILEPYIFQSNVSFELVREFYEDLRLLLSIIKDFDEHH